MNKKRSVKKFYGFYRGVVRKQLNNGYCLIRIPGILDYEKDENLPPAEPAQEICGGRSDNGTFVYPDINSNVWCFFANGDIRQPIYFASSNARSVHWIDVSQKLKSDKNPSGFPKATEVHSTGTETIYGKTIISQTNILDPNKVSNEKDDNIEISKIDLRVFRTNEDLERITRQSIDDDGYKKDVKDLAGQVNYGSDIIPAGEIIITNGSGGAVIIKGGTSIKISAPLIELDTTNTGGTDNGEIKLKAGKIEFRTTDGTIELNNSNVAINVRNGKQLLTVGDKDAQLVS